MKRLISFLSTIMLLLMLAPTRAEAWTNITLVSSNSSINGKQLTKNSDNEFRCFFDLSSSSEDLSFKFHVSDDGGFDIGYYNATDNPTSEITDFSGNTSYWCSKKGNNDLTLKHSTSSYKTYKLVLEYKEQGGDNQTYWTVKVTGDGLKSDKGVDPDAYYFVSPELTDGKMLDGFKFSPARVRGGGDLSSGHWSFNLQDFLIRDDLIKDGKIHYYIAKGDGTVTYRPYHPNNNNYELGNNGKNNDYAGLNTKYGVYEESKCTDISNTNVFSLSKGKGVSYTWLLNTDNKLEIIVNPTAFGGTDAGAYYLVGNASNTNEDIDPKNPANRRLMRKFWYKGGLAYFDEQVGADSVVYRVTIPRPEESWKNLYLAIFSKDYIDNLGTASGVDWGNAIRPEEQWEVSSGNYDGFDATALHGGLFAKGVSSSNQTINPQIGNDVTSCTFSMNVTTSTYRLILNPDNLYIMGPAVENGDETNGWSTDKPHEETTNALKMTYVPAEQCYKRLDSYGNETKVKLVAGKKFAFVYNKNFSNVFFAEDLVTPVSLVGESGESTEADTYGLASNDDVNKRKDTQYVNFLRQRNDVKYDNVSELEEKVRPCTFNLPTGEYTIRLYISTSQIAGHESTPVYYYVIKERDYTFYRPDAYETKLGGYNTFKSFCDYHAVVIPEDIDVFTVSSTDNTNKTVSLSEYALGTDRVLPAEVPVILAKKETGVRQLTNKVTMENYKVPNLTKTVSGNLLKGQINRSSIEASNADGKRNFLFGYKRLKTTDEKVTIGFYAPGSGSCSINTAYLQLDGDFLGGTAGAKGWTLVLDDSGVTGIDSVDDSGSSVEDDAYYTLQGVKVAAPTVSGIYIHNGRKIIVK